MCSRDPADGRRAPGRHDHGVRHDRGAIAATKQGAFYYFTKPFKNDEVLVVIRNAIEQRRLVRENRDLRDGCDRTTSVRRDHRRQRQDASRLRSDRARGTEPGDRAHSGRERHGQGARRAGVPSPIGARGPGVRHGQLRQPPGGSARIEPVRARERRLHRRRLSQEGPVRACRQGDDLLRRDRQHPARDAGEAAAGDAGTRVHAPRRRRDDQGGHADHCRDQRQLRARWRRTGSAKTCSTG